MTVYLMTLFAVCLAGEMWYCTANAPGGNGVNSPSIYPLTQPSDKRKENPDAQTTECIHDSLRIAVDHNNSKEGRRGWTEDSEWWQRYASKSHLNRSGSQEVKERRVVQKVSRSDMFYDHLDVLILDLVHALGLTFLQVYTNSGLSDTLLLQKVTRYSRLRWAVWPCFGAVAPPSRYHLGLAMVLCDSQSTVELLTKAAKTKVLTQHVWLLLHTTRGSLQDHIPPLYVPIDSQVIEVMDELEGNGNLLTLYEIWSPGSDVPLKSGLVGIWAADSNFRGRHAHGPWAIATDRLRLYPKPKYERRKNLTGVHFIVTSINDTRAQKSYFDTALGRDVLTGYFGDVWELLKAEMNFTYSVTTPADGLFGSLSGGRWTGLIGDLLGGRAHVVVALLSQTYARAQVIDYSSVLIKFSYRIFARPQARSSVSWSSYTRPFSTGLWIGIGLTIVLLAAIFYSISQWYQRQEVQKAMTEVERKTIRLADPEVTRYRLNKRDSLLLMWAALTQQGWPEAPEMDSLRILFWAAYMVGVVVVAAYSATLVSFLTVADSGLPFASLADLKNLGRYRLGILKGSVLEEFFKNQNFIEYWNAVIEPYSDTLAASYDELRTLARGDSDFAYVGSYEIQRLDPVGACTFHSARQHLLFNDGSLGWPSGSPYVGIFDYHIIRLKESGLLQKLTTKWYPQAYNCVDESVMPLGFQQVFTAFVALGLGASLSLIFLSGEKLFFHRSADNYRYQSSKAQVAKVKNSAFVS